MVKIIGQTNKQINDMKLHVIQGHQVVSSILFIMAPYVNVI